MKSKTIYLRMIMTGFLLQSLYLAAWQDRSLNVYGFISQGYLKSSEHNYLTDSEDGSFEFTEAAVNVMGSFGDSLRAGLQLFSRDLGDQGNHEVVIDWAYGEYLWRDEMSFRIGRIKHPLGFYNQGRDADLLRPSVLLPQAVYPEGLRDIILAYQGVSIYGTLPGDIEYDIYGGATHLDEDNPTLRSLVFQLAGDVEIPEKEIKNKKQMGAALKWNTPIEGLAVGASYLTANLEGSLTVKPFPNLPATLDLEFEIKDLSFSFYSAEYQRDQLTLAAEFFDLQFQPEGVQETFNPQGWYISGAWRFNDHWEIHANYNEFYPDGKDKDGAMLTIEEDVPNWFAWQKDYTVGARIDITPQFIVKLEWHQISGMGLIWAYDIDNLEEPYEEDWTQSAVKATFHF